MKIIRKKDGTIIPVFPASSLVTKEVKPNYDSTTTATTTTTTSTTSGRKSPTFDIDSEISEMKKNYIDILGRQMPHHIETEIRQHIAACYDPDVEIMRYHYALKETAAAPRPSWAYVRAIVHRLEVTNSNDYERYFALPY